MKNAETRLEILARCPDYNELVRDLLARRVPHEVIMQEVMRFTQGRANPTVVKALLDELGTK